MRGAVFLLLLVILILARPRLVLARVCMPHEVTDTVIWRSDMQGIPIHESASGLFAALRKLDGPSFWVRTVDYGRFDIPDGYTVEAKFWVLPSRNMVWFASHPSQPDRRYVFWFPDDPLFAMPDGSHFGIHPCRAFVISRRAAEQVYHAARKGGGE